MERRISKDSEAAQKPAATNWNVGITSIGITIIRITSTNITNIIITSILIGSNITSSKIMNSIQSEGVPSAHPVMMHQRHIWDEH